jgi:hypothetical protein
MESSGRVISTRKLTNREARDLNNYADKISFFFTEFRSRNTKSTRVRAFLINPLTSELNPSAQRSLTRFFTGDFAS